MSDVPAGADELLPEHSRESMGHLVGFPARCAQLCGDFAPAGASRAIDVGCSVGGAAFELSRRFEDVVGVDFSQAFVDAAAAMAADGEAPYTTLVSGTVFEDRVARLPAGVDASRVAFEQGDACALPERLGTFDAVLASNLLCRLPRPLAFLERLESLVNPGGVVVLVSPYSWLEEYTPVEHWMGATPESPDSFAAVSEVLSQAFELEHQAPMPFLIREHARKFQYGCSDGSVWRRRS